MNKNDTAHWSKRRRFAAFGLLGCSALGFTHAGFAEDATCKLLFDAMERSAVAPSHQYLNFTMVGLNGGKPKLSESINTGKEIYRQSDGKWTKSPKTPDSMRASIEEKRKTSQSSCKFVQDEAVEGVSASLYLVHEEGIDSKIWIGKQNSLPIRVVSDMDTSMHSETRYVYGSVSAPAIIQ